MDKYWDAAGDLFDSLTIEVMTTAKLVDIVADPYYSPFEDKRIQEGVARWKKRDAST